MTYAIAIVRNALRRNSNPTIPTMPKAGRMVTQMPYSPASAAFFSAMYKQTAAVADQLIARHG